MKEFKDKTAVITGATTGLGPALAKRCLEEGMKVVIADGDAQALSQVENELKKTGTSIISVVTDVSDPKQVEALTKKTRDTYGAIHLLFNNATKGLQKSILKTTMTEWEDIIGVNLWGAVNCMRIFIPIMLDQREDCHIVNVASIAGVICGLPENAGLSLTNHAIVSISEVLDGEMGLVGSKIKISVVCPSYLNLGLENHSADAGDVISYRALMNVIVKDPSIETIMERIFNGIKKGRLYIFPDAVDTHVYVRELVQTRLDTVIKSL